MTQQTSTYTNLKRKSWTHQVGVTVEQGFVRIRNPRCEVTDGLFRKHTVQSEMGETHVTTYAALRKSFRTALAHAFLSTRRRATGDGN